MTLSSLAEQQYNTDSSEPHHFSAIRNTTDTDVLTTATNHLQILQRAMLATAGYLEIRSFDEKVKTKNSGKSYFLPVDGDEDHWKGVVKFLARENAQGRGIFVGVNPRNSDTDGSKKSIGKLTTVIVDIDLKNANYSKEEALEIIKERCPIQPDLIVFSGNGFHLYFFMKPTDNTEDWEDFQATLQELFGDLGADMSVVTDYSRVLRLAGFRNWKYDKEDGGRVTGIVEFTPREKTPSISAYVAMFDVKPSRRKTGKRILPDSIPEGGTIGGEGRNTTLYKEGCALRDRGYTEDEIFASLMIINEKRCEPPMPEDEVRDITRSASKHTPTKGIGDGRDEELQPSSSRLLKSFGDIRKAEYPPQDWLIYGLLRGWIGLFYAIYDSGKTTLLRNIVIMLAVGRSYLNGIVPENRPLKVWYLDFEDNTETIAEDIDRMTSHLSEAERQMVRENLFFYSAMDADMPDLDLSNPAHLKWVEEVAIENGIELLVIDTMQKAFSPKNENDNSEVGRTIKSVQAMAKRVGCGVLIAHHMGKWNADEGGAANSHFRARGASALQNDVKLVIELDKKKSGTTLKYIKVKAKMLEETVITLDPETRWFDAERPERIHEVSETAYSQVVRIVASANGTMRTSEVIAKASPLSASTVEKQLKKATKAGDLLKIQNGLYAPAEWIPNGCPEGTDCQDLTLTYPAVN